MLVLRNSPDLLDHDLLDPAVLAGKLSHDLIGEIKLNLTDKFSQMDAEFSLWKVMGKQTGLRASKSKYFCQLMR